MTVAERIKTLRKKAGLTQTELGEKLGVKKNAVSKWECGRVEEIPSSKIKAMAALFQVPASSLIDDNWFEIELFDSDPQIEQLMSQAKQLNAQGLERLIQHAEDLLGNPSYQKTDRKS